MADGFAEAFGGVDARLGELGRGAFVGGLLFDHILLQSLEFVLTTADVFKLGLQLNKPKLELFRFNPVLARLVVQGLQAMFNLLQCLGVGLQRILVVTQLAHGLVHV